MTLLKWLLVIGGVLFLAFIASIVGMVYWASGIEGVHVAQADLAVGGSYPAEERTALLDACAKRNVTKREDSCTCVADRAGAEMSRYERLILTAGLEGSASKVVALSKGLMESGVPAERIKAVDKDAQQRVTAIMQACGMN